MVDVTTEALQTVKSALTTFQTDIDGIAQRSSNYSYSVVGACKEHINQTKSEVSQMEVQIVTLNKQIEDFERQINQSTNEYNNLVSRIPQIQNNIRSLDARIFSLNSQITSLRSQLANTDDDDLRQQIEEQISVLTRQLYQCEEEQDQLENELRNSEKKTDELQQDISAAKSQKAQCENDLSIQQNRCNKLKSKLERLTLSFGRVENDLRAFVAATKKFENASSDTIQNKTNSIESCMASIEEYLSTNL